MISPGQVPVPIVITIGLTRKSLMSLLVTCDCGKRLQVKDSLAGKRIRCPECQEPLTVPAVEVDESDEEPAPKKAPVRAAAKVPAKAKRAPEPDDESEEEDEQPRIKAKGKKKGKKAAKASSNLVLLGVGGGVLVLVVVVVAVLLIMNNQPESKKPGPQALNKVEGKDQAKPDGKKDAKGNPDGKKAAPVVNPGFAEAAKQVEGAWVMNLPGGITVHYDYRADGNFTLKTQGGDKSVTASGTWKVAVIAKESCQLKRSGGVAAPPFYEPNDTVAIYFNTVLSVKT